MPKPQTKDLSGSDVIQLRDFLARAGWSAESAPRAAMGPADKTLAVSPTLMVAMDHHEARIFHILDAPDGETGEVIKPYDPHHFRHHLTHRGQTQEQGQRAPEDFSFYEQITQTLKSAEKIILIGHGTGKSNAAHHLVEYLRTHAPETYQHVIGEAVADLSSITTPQFFELGQQALRQ